MSEVKKKSKSRTLDDYKGQRVNRAQAIRWKCLDCTGNQQTEVRFCPVRECPLWPYRMKGKWQDPNAVDDANENAPQNRLEAAEGASNQK